eukprot:TRINITY_DN7598_c0_g1_i1.p1 TRINITY_DN7598_c0_g1~~TRINITY_DN7598_c0_g1_i1.p1  ORF type:complete len:364 (+),score=68.44 TRINITY_DN7598_c0_g1_i1:52-1143(+)
MKGYVINSKPAVKGLKDVIKCSDSISEPRDPKGSEVQIEVFCGGIAIDEIHCAEESFLGGLPTLPRTVTPERPAVPGVEAVGKVIKIGPKAKKDIKIGDIVHGVTAVFYNREGGWAERVNLSQFISKLPESITYEEGIASGMSGLVATSAYQAIKYSLTDVTDPHVLVVGATGSIGTLILNILRHVKCRATAVCSGKNESFARSHGATNVFDYTKGSFLQQFTESGEPLFDAVIDCIGGKEVEIDGYKVLKKKGAFLTLAGDVKYIGDERMSTFVMAKNFVKWGAKFAFSKLTSQSWAIANPTESTVEECSTFRAEGVFKPHINKVIPFGDMDAVTGAIELVSSHRTTGKVVLKFPAYPENSS